MAGLMGTYWEFTNSRMQILIHDLDSKINELDIVRNLLAIERGANNDQLRMTRDELALIRIRNDELLEQLGQSNRARRSLQEERSDNRALITDLRGKSQT